jgi:hypothetical protein
MLKGFNYPLTPSGKSALNPQPPWYYSADFFDIEFWSDPSAVAALSPKELDLDASANGHCNALFYDWQFSGDNEEYLTLRVISAASFSYSWTPFMRASRSHIARISLWTTMRPLLVVGSKAIRSVWARYSKPGITPPPSLREGNGSLKDW